MQKKMQESLLFWACLGPCMILLIFLVDSLRFSYDHIYLFPSLFFALPLSFKGSKQSLSLSLAILFASFFFALPEEIYWHMGICTAMALSLVVVSLAAQEHQDLFDSVKTESKSRLDQLLRLDEKLKKVNEQALIKEEEAALVLKKSQESLVLKEKELSAAREIAAALEIELESLRAKQLAIHSKESLAPMDRKPDLHEMQEQEQKVEQEPCVDCKSLEDKLSQSADREKILQEQLQKRDQSLYMHHCREAEMQRKIFMQEQLLSQEQEKKGNTGNWDKKIEVIESKLHASFQDLILNDKISQPQPAPQEKKDDKKLFLKHARGLKNFSREMQDLKQTKALYQQLRKQFDEKTNVLQQSRKDLFFCETKLETFQLDEKNKVFDHIESEQFYEEQIRQLCEENEQYQNEIEELENLLDLIA